MKTAIVVVLLACAFGVATAGPSAAQLAKDRADAAERVYKGMEARMKAATAKPEAACVWSVRWLEAALDVAASAKDKKQALVDHQTRMQAVEDLAKRLKDAGALDVSDADAATYFRIEAEQWVARGKR